MPHNHDRPGWDKLDARPVPPPADDARATVVMIIDDVPRTYVVETWDPPYGPGEYATGVVVDRLAAIVAALQQPDRRVRITRLDPPSTAVAKPPPADPNVWPEPTMVKP